MPPDAGVLAPQQLGAEISVLSVGAIEPGLLAAAEAFQREGGSPARIKFANTPAIRKLVASGVAADILIAPPAAIDDLTRDGKVIGDDRVYVGRVGIGVMVREGAAVPDISDAHAVRRAVLEADSVVFNRSSSGLSAETMLRKLGIFDQILPKTTRFETGHNGREMMEHLVNADERIIGFGAIIEIVLFRSWGVKLVGPLPPDIQHYTSYMAVEMAAAANPAGAKALMRYLSTLEARALFAAHGID